MLITKFQCKLFQLILENLLTKYIFTFTLRIVLWCLGFPDNSGMYLLYRMTVDVISSLHVLF